MASGAPIFHITTRAAWDAAVTSNADFEAASLKSEGFIHCSTSEQAAWVGNQRFRGFAEPLVLLRIDTDLLTSEIRWETAEAGRAPFPHIYGRIDRKAVADVLPFLEGPQGFLPPTP